MKKTSFTLLAYLLSLIACFAQTWQWAKQGGGSGGCQQYDYGNNLIVDNSGYVYVTGHYMSDPIIFGPYYLSLEGCSDIFIAKYNSNGDILWAKRAGSPNNPPPLAGDFSYGITIDDSANFYITGNVKGSSASFGSISIPISPSANSNFFIAKYDSSGNCSWAKSTLPTSNTSKGYAVDINSSYLYTCGFFKGNVIFGQDTLTTTVLQDIFIARYDVLTGECLWAKQANCTSPNGANAMSIVAGNKGDCYIGGGFYGTITFGNCSLSSGGDSIFSGFLAKFDSLGNCIWAKKSQGVVVNDSLDNLYMYGMFKDTITIDTFFLTSNGGYDLSLAKYDSNGKCLWAKAIGGSGNEYTYNILAFRSLAMSQSGTELYLIGKTDSGFTYGSCSVPSGSFIMQFDSSGKCNWNIVDPSRDASSIAVGLNNDIYITGGFLNSVSFGSTTLTSLAFADMYLAKLDGDTGVQTPDNVSAGFFIYPNPSDGSYTLEISSDLLNSKMFIYDVLGKVIFETVLSKNKTAINIPSLTQGVYVVKLQTPHGKSLRQSIVKQ